MPSFCDVLPFGDEELTEIPLSSPPLLVVIAQVRFPMIASIANQGFIGSFQEELRPYYPIMRQEQEVQFAITPDGAVQAQAPNAIWRFIDLDENWRVTLAPSFLSLDVGDYTSRSEFITRFRSVLQALENHFAPQVFDRLGVRYVNRLVLDNQLPSLEDLARREVLGIVGQEIGGEATVLRSISDNEVHTPEGVMHARWGVLPADFTLDPFHGPPIDKPSWLLDLDMYTPPSPRPFSVKGAAELAESFATRIYGVFRWAVSSELLDHFGGNQ